jgi:hypothetical protein
MSGTIEDPSTHKGPEEAVKSPPGPGGGQGDFWVLAHGQVGKRALGIS